MSYFTDFQPEELSLILSIPYRAGIYVSRADDIEGCDRDDVKEQAALEKILDFLKDKAGKGTFAAATLDEILSHKAEWDGWAKNGSDLLADTIRSIALVKARLPNSELALYRWCVFQTAKTVAMAASEKEVRSDNLSKAMGGGVIMKLRNWMDSRNIEALPENISAKEKDALQKLQAALKG